MGWGAISIDGAASNRILSLFYRITGISFYSVDNSIFVFLYNTYMVGYAVTFPVADCQPKRPPVPYSAATL